MMRLAVLSTVQNGALILLACTSLYLALQLSTLNSEMQQHPSNEQLTSLQEDIDRVDSLVDDLKKMSLATSADQQANNREIRIELKELGQALQQPPDIEVLQLELAELSADLKSMQAQVLTLKTAIEARPAPTVRSGISGQSPAPLRKKSTTGETSPPFQILGVESRGNELFLAVSPMDLSHLANVELLRPSHSFMGWRVKTLALAEAQFRRPDGKFFTAQIR